MNPSGTVYLVDDEPGMLKALTRLLQAENFNVLAFPSATEFLAACAPEIHGCLVLDVAMEGLDGMELQQRLLSLGSTLPIIFLTGHGDIPMSVRAIKSGAVDFLTKPVQDEELLAAVRAALTLADARETDRRATDELRSRLNRLTPREREVMEHVITGKLNKHIATELGTGEQTVKIHRMRMMEKMGLESVAELVRVAARLGVNPRSS